MRVGPASINYCLTGCKKRQKFAQLCEKHPEEFRVYGTICKKCVPSAIVRSITVDTLEELEEPFENEVLMVISNSKIVFDKYKVATRGKSQCPHLFTDNDRMVGCGINIDNNDNTCTDKIIYKIRDNRYDTIFHVKPPGAAIFPIPYLVENADKIAEEINSSNCLDISRSYKCNITAFVKYYKSGINGYEYGGVFYPSEYLELPAYSGALDEPYLGGLIVNLEDVMNVRNSKMEGSDWVFMGIGKIYVTFIKTSGRSIINVRDYVALPANKRGSRSIINLNYHKKLHRTVSEEPEAECLGWAVRCYKVYSKIPNGEMQDRLISDLTQPDGYYPIDYWRQMAAESVIMLADVGQTGNFSLKHFKQLEKLNGFPIALYNLEKVGEGSVTISCLLGPDKKLVEEGLPICNLIMITPSHVAFVPNFKRYMKTIFHDRPKTPLEYYHRCQICFFKFQNEKQLNSHLSNGTCICKKAQPCRMILEKDLFINDTNMLDEMQPDLTVVADTECLVQDLDANNDGNGDDEDMIEGLNLPGEGSGNRLSKHVPHSVGVLLLDHNLKKICYKLYWGVRCC